MDPRVWKKCNNSKITWDKFLKFCYFNIIIRMSSSKWYHKDFVRRHLWRLPWHQTSHGGRRKYSNSIELMQIKLHNLCICWDIQLKFSEFVVGYWQFPWQKQDKRPQDVMTDILRELDTGNLAVLTLLDLSAAFDTVDHATLLRRLNVTYCLDGSSDFVLHDVFDVTDDVTGLSPGAI